MNHRVSNRAKTRPPRSILAGYAVAGLCLIPVGWLLLRAFSGGSEPMRMLLRPATLEATWRSLRLVFAVTATALTLGTAAAWLTTRSDLPLRRLWSVLLILPLVFPSYVAAMAFLSATSPNGILGGFGIDFQGFPAAWFLLSIFTAPYAMLTVRAGLQRVDASQQDAARSLGQSPTQAFFQITLPQLRRSLWAGALLIALYTLSDFGAVYLLQEDTLTRQVYGYRNYKPNTAAAYALVLVLLSLVIVFLEPARRPAPARRIRPPAPVALGGWRWPAFGFCMALMLASLALPLITLVQWLLRAITLGEPLLRKPWIIANSLVLSAVAAFLTIVIALVPALLAWHYPGWRTRLVERASYIAYAIPGVVIGFAFMSMSLQFGGWLYQSLAVLVLAFTVHFLPQASSTTGGSLAQIHPNLLDAGRTLGSGRRKVLRTILLPLASPGLLAGAALVFLTCMKELPMTLLLRPTGFDTLATQIWSDTEEGFFSHAALPALLLVGASGFSVWLLLRRSRY